MKDFRNDVAKASEYITRKIDGKIPQTAVILGSGLGGIAEKVQNDIRIPYSDIPGFPVSTIEGHSGELVFGSLNNCLVCLMKGRIHYYEGYEPDHVVFPIRVFLQLGIKNLIITNASGGINKSFHPGDFMIIKDHINWGRVNPLIGRNWEAFGPRFPDTSQTYNRALIDLAYKTAKELAISVREGVYLYTTGPSYETAAEIRAFRKLGADVVGMSTVPEALVAIHGNMKIIGISCITNMATGINDKQLDHNDVIENAALINSKFIQYISSLLKNMDGIESEN